jgi:hypothetical protein
MTTECLTRHAATRVRQRSIPPIVIHWLDEFGEEYFDGHGGVVTYFSKESRQELERKLGRRFVKENAKYLDRYVVRSATDGVMITAGVRRKRLPRR